MNPHQQSMISENPHPWPTGRVAVVIPSYRVKAHILVVLGRIGAEVEKIYVVDDACPDRSGQYVLEHSNDPRVTVLTNPQNLGVGGATMAGMQRAAEDGMDVIVKIDGDGQMDPALIPAFVGVILSGEADYAKGNRFFELEGLATMPFGRLVGNAGLSFLSKVSTGYWRSFDPTNGFIAIHASLIKLLPLEKIAKRYFFESDLLFRLNVLSALVVDVPMYSHYADELSGLNPWREIPRFARAHMGNFIKRIFYNYFIRNFSIASLELFLGCAMTISGLVFGLTHWGGSSPASAGTVMVAALQILVGVQLLIAFVNYDIESVPNIALHPRLRTSRRQMRSLKHSDQAAAESSAAAPIAQIEPVAPSQL